MDPIASSKADPLAAPKKAIQVGPPPDWVVPVEFDPAFEPPRKEHLTFLLIDRQVHSELQETYTQLVVRLETTSAVQRESQWRLQFEPFNQSIILHWIRIYRGGQLFDHTHLDRGRLLQREEGLEGYVIDGWFTFLLLLEDIRPGDMLSSCHTRKCRPRLIPQHCTSSVELPPGTSVGKVCFSVRFGQSRPMKWKAVDADLAPDVRNAQGETVWRWSRAPFIANPLELNTPPWCCSAPWIQVSDCPEWSTVAQAFSREWKEEADSEMFASLANEIAQGEIAPLKRIEKAVQFVQDQCRYLSVNLELNGLIPTAPSVVARRRFGDCKDLSFLLVHLLKHFGVPSRPVLVSTRWGKAVGNMLPSPEVFNHAVVEFQAEGKTRWVDTTARHQGGDVLSRATFNFGVGLPLAPDSCGLVDAPTDQQPESRFELTETVLLNTTGLPSLLGIFQRATGYQADLLRQDFEARGVAQIAEERLRHYAKRFQHVKCERPLQYHDARAENEFTLAEVLEIDGCLNRAQHASLCTFTLPPSLIFAALQLPEENPRRTPFGLPFPCEIVQTLEVRCSSFEPMAAPYCSLRSRFLRFSRRQKSLVGSWSMTLTLSTVDDSVPPDEMEEHAKLVERIWRESVWGLHVPVGCKRPRASSDFGMLPSAKAEIAPTPSATVHPVSRTLEEPVPEWYQGESRRKPVHPRRKRKLSAAELFVIGFFFVFGLSFILFILWLSGGP